MYGYLSKFRQLLLKIDVAPAAPAAGNIVVYSKTGGSVFIKDEAGVESELATVADINAVIDAAPGALDTLNELAAALGDDSNFAATMTTALALKATIVQVQQDTLKSAVAGGTADALTATLTPVPAYADMLRVYVRASGANTVTNPTLNLNSLGALTIYKHGGLALAVGDIKGAGHELELAYRASPARWELLNPAVAASSGGTAAGTTIADAGGYYTGADVEAALQEIGAGGIGGGGGSGAAGPMEYIGEVAVAGAAATTISFSGLDLDADGSYYGQIIANNNTATPGNVLPYLNADSTATNYDSQLFAAAGATGSGGRANNARMADLPASGDMAGEFILFKDFNNKPTYLYRGRESATTLIRLVTSAVMWRTAGTNVTTILLTSSVASGFAIGSKLRLWKIKASAGSGGGGFELVGSAVVAGAAAQTIGPISGLNLSAHDEYEIRVVAKGAAADGYAYLYVNGDTTDANYYSSVGREMGGAMGGGEANEPRAAYIVNGAVTYGKGFMALDTDGKASFFGDFKAGATSAMSRWVTAIYKTAAANVTSVELKHATAAGFAVGSKIEVWKKVTAFGASGSSKRIGKTTLTGHTTYGPSTIPLDNTTPQVGEGVEATGLAITVTPTDASSTLRGRIMIPSLAADGGGTITVAIFRDGAADAIATALFAPPGAAYTSPFVMEYEVATGSIAATTFTVRMGANVSRTNHLNGYTGTTLNNTMASTHVVEQIAP